MGGGSIEIEGAIVEVDGAAQGRPLVRREVVLGQLREPAEVGGLGRKNVV